MSTALQQPEQDEGVSEFISQALATFDHSRRAIASVKHYGELTVSADGIGKVTEARKAVKRLRIDIDKRRKELNEGALKYQRAVNEEAKRLTAEIEPIEGKLTAEEENYEAEKAREKAAIEADKQTKLQGRLNRLALAGCFVGDIAAVQQMDDEFFEIHLTTETAKAEAARIEREQHAENLRIARERLEADRLRQEAELTEIRKQQEAEREDLRKQQEEVAKQQAEIKAKQLAERQAEEARAAKERLEAAKAAEEARLAALQPDIDKAREFGQSLLTDVADELARLGNPWWSHKAKRLAECLAGDLVNIVAAGRGE